MTEQEVTARVGAADDDAEDVRRAVEDMDPVTPEVEGVRLVETRRLGHVSLLVFWEPDPDPEDVEQTLDCWPEEKQRIHRSGGCTYWMCSVLAMCGHLEAQADIGLVQVAEEGGDDDEEGAIERDLAVEAITGLLRQAEANGREAQATL